mgnify:CR=1 FL=1
MDTDYKETYFLRLAIVHQRDLQDKMHIGYFLV